MLRGWEHVLRDWEHVLRDWDHVLRDWEHVLRDWEHVLRDWEHVLRDWECAAEGGVDFLFGFLCVDCLFHFSVFGLFVRIFVRTFIVVCVFCPA